MAGQVKHKQIFSSIRPDWRLAKLLLSLRTRNTDMLLGAVAKVLGDEGIELISSTSYLEPLLAKAGSAYRARARTQEELDIDYGRGVAALIAGYDIGQTVVVAGAGLRGRRSDGGHRRNDTERAGALMQSLEDAASTLERSLTVVKVAKPKQDMRFDVPVIGVATIEAMRHANATCLAIEAGRTLIFDRAMS